ncbi:astacin-like metalloendopeptidase-like precursor [Pelodiscus sinensis]|uniref:Metalloendopeptidase n=1 Tax=Pelodiscus sinensis TaxID=13735 RepID=Q587K7_PELSI|nr:astacin-like metalloendopeptidase-like precursor [Pelodiscus sinensis]BAD95471.1 high choriolytic enzyme [Pelodiscus sinensis]|eukprot:NP_001273823.1 astacin-like metalloendopeptidase-like precursor [Pelodiscus sinensis]
MLLLFTAPLLYSTLGFPIQEYDGYEDANFTAYPTTSDVTPSSDILQSTQEVELAAVTDTEEDVFNRILKANANSTEHLREGDIVMTRSRSAIGCSGRPCFWTQSSDGIVRVPYIFSTDYDEAQMQRFSEAMAEFETLTCIDFVNRTTELDYLNIKSGKGCWSHYGKIGGGQIVSVMKQGCMWKGIIQHELNHALGFVHEQARSDRDNYIKIMWEYISSGNEGNFKKIENSNNLGLQYDYSSVMHYGTNAFSNTPGKATIVPIPDASVPVGQRYGLSNLDVAKINKLYNCNRCSTILDSPSGSLSSESYQSKNSGNATCFSLIRIPSKRVSLQFDAFNLQTSKDCKTEYIKIYDGVSQSSEVLLNKTCGTESPPTITASGKNMLVEFVRGGTGAATGFKASYTSVKTPRAT